MKPTTTHAHANHRPRHDGMESGQHSDPYQQRRKPPQPSSCPDCQATFQQGRWSWEAPPAGAGSHRCPACERIRDRVPAGELSLEGSFLAAHAEEVMRLVNNTEQRIRQEHPLERLIDTSGDPAGGAVLLRFTGIHATHGLGKALVKAFGGTLNAPYPDAGSPMRAHWQRG
ncbi:MULTISPECIES: BCAM0308 family protein [Aphanothece]|uniref:BCAM0308 family protein n=1 Tax=Aphanothece TaxID=1121 RepID=UPI00398486C9